MKKYNDSVIDRIWPIEELESVDHCPYCASNLRTLAYKDAQDWCFYSAPGKWTYWDCNECNALYLNPRPKEATISKAYSKYYTHNSSVVSFKQKFKTRLRNEHLSHRFNINLLPRFNLPRVFNRVLMMLKSFVVIPFGFEQLIKLPKRKLIDVGCGSGTTLKLAKELGWSVTGLEIDIEAVRVARSFGLDVIEGDYRNLEQISNKFDCIICSHVLEHVYNPVDMLNLLISKLAPSGILLLSLPNSQSHVREQFGENWRGLEAPRHIAIPSLSWLRDFLKKNGYFVEQMQSLHDLTSVASNQIMTARSKEIKVTFPKSIFYKLSSELTPEDKCDFIQFVCSKKLPI